MATLGSVGMLTVVMAVPPNLYRPMVNIGMRFKTFAEYVKVREGLWVADSRAVEGWSELPRPVAVHGLWP